MWNACHDAGPILFFANAATGANPPASSMHAEYGQNQAKGGYHCGSRVILRQLCRVSSLVADSRAGFDVIVSAGSFLPACEESFLKMPNKVASLYLFVIG
jgi:hypothetical protein